MYSHTNFQVYNTVLLITVTMLDIIRSLKIIYLTTRRWHLLISISLLMPPVLGKYSLLLSFRFLDSTCKWDHTVFVLLCLTYFIKHNALNVSVVAHHKIAFFFYVCNDIPLYTYAPHFLYLLIQRWTFPCLGCCEECCNEYGSADMSSRQWSHFF